MAWTYPLNLLGSVVQGDLGDHTIYTNIRGKKVSFPRVKPHDPPSQARQLQRARFKFAQACWKALTAEQKLCLEQAACATSLVMTGQNLFIGCTLRRRPDLYHCIESQCGVPLPPLQSLP